MRRSLGHDAFEPGRVDEERADGRPQRLTTGGQFGAARRSEHRALEPGGCRTCRAPVHHGSRVLRLQHRLGIGLSVHLGRSNGLSAMRSDHCRDVPELVRARPVRHDVRRSPGAAVAGRSSLQYRVPGTARRLRRSRKQSRGRYLVLLPSPIARMAGARSTATTSTPSRWRPSRPRFATCSQGTPSGGTWSPGTPSLGTGTSPLLHRLRHELHPPRGRPASRSASGRIVDHSDPRWPAGAPADHPLGQGLTASVSRR